MSQMGFSAEKYMEMQTKHILERIENSEGNRLYLEFGGKLVQDKHAMRVLPGFDENAKIKKINVTSNQRIYNTSIIKQLKKELLTDDDIFELQKRRLDFS